jgi:mono/diheme cytochrome c family protein
MPPFAPFLTDTEVALVLTYIRNAWGNQASAVGAAEVNPYRTASLD